VNREAGLPYRREEGRMVIELALSDVMQMFNSFDPSPFHERDLDDDAEDYIVGAAREIGPREPLKLALYLGRPPDGLPFDLVSSIYKFFRYRAQSRRRDLRLCLRRGRAGLAIGLLFLAGTMLAQRAVAAFLPHSTATDTVREWILICGWVAMWRPFEIFLYDWWPIARDIRIFDRLSEMEIEIRSAGPAAR